MMNAAQRELLRYALLMFCEQAGVYAMTPPMLHLYARRGGHNVELDDVKKEIAYLVDGKLLARDAKFISPENAGYLITKEGRDHLAEQGLA